MKKPALFLAMMFFATTVAAHSFSIDMVREGNMDHLKQEINSYSYPGYIGSLVGDQKVNVVIESENGTRTVGAELNGTKVEKLKTEPLENETVEITVSEQQISNITASDQPAQVLSQQIKSGEISYETNGFVNEVKFYLAEQALKIFSGL